MHFYELYSSLTFQFIIAHHLAVRCCQSCSCNGIRYQPINNACVHAMQCCLTSCHAVPISCAQQTSTPAESQPCLLPVALQHHRHHQHHYHVVTRQSSSFNAICVVLQPWLWPAGDPLRLSRNITLATANFSQAAGNYASINLEFLEGRALIAKNVTVTVRDIALGRARRSSGQGIPFFAGGCAALQVWTSGVLVCLFAAVLCVCLQRRCWERAGIQRFAGKMFAGEASVVRQWPCTSSISQHVVLQEWCLHQGTPFFASVWGALQWSSPGCFYMGACLMAACSWYCSACLCVFVLCALPCSLRQLRRSSSGLQAAAVCGSHEMLGSRPPFFVTVQRLQHTAMPFGAATAAAAAVRRGGRELRAAHGKCGAAAPGVCTECCRPCSYAASNAACAARPWRHRCGQQQSHPEHIHV